MNNSKYGTGKPPDLKIYAIRRVSGHLRLEADRWAFIYFCDEFKDFEKTHMLRQVPNNAMTPLTDWLNEAISPQTPQEHLDRLGHDGFGLVVKILWDIKSSWKLLLGEMEEFLDELVRIMKCDTYRIGLTVSE